MNDVIDKLAEIEKAAVRITENAGTQKAKIAKEFEEKIKEFDNNFQKQTNSRIERMKAENDRNIQKEIQQMRQDSIREIKDLEEKYKACHTRLAQEIVNRLTGV